MNDNTEKRRNCSINGHPMSYKTFLIALPFIALFEICGRKILNNLELTTAKSISKLFKEDI